MKLAILATVITLFTSQAYSHGLMIEPPQRGILGGSKFAPGMKSPVNGAPKDPFSHFPAGDKSVRPGAGKLSQERQANFKWTPFEPMQKGFRWRAGVCGDLKSAPQDHLRGGKYYFNGAISRTFRQGGIIEVGHAIIAHHNGFVEMHVCDVRRCGGEVSESCFFKGYCHKLRRARNRVCDSGYSKDCAPVDRNFPERWYLPCSRDPASGFDVYSPKFAQFELPFGLTCDHCVLHWFWTSANNCNPPGVVEYFEGPDRPKAWGKCRGQGGAVGGYTRVQKPCGGREFPEEYYQCADIKITKDSARSGRGKRGFSTRRSGEKPPRVSVASPSRSPSPSSSPSPEPRMKKKYTKKMEKKEKKKRRKYKKRDTSAPTLSSQPSASTAPSSPSSEIHKSKQGKAWKKTDAGKRVPGNPFKTIKLFADGRVVRKLHRKDKFKNLKFGKLTFKVITSRPVKWIDFYIDGKKVWTEYTAPYYMFGNSGNMPHFWPTPIVNRLFTLEVRAEGYSFKALLKFINW